MKNLIETTGEFQLMDTSTGFLVPHDRPSVPPGPSEFINSRATLGQVKVLASVSDDATDEEFAKFWVECEGDKELAIQSFTSKFPDGEAPVVSPQPEKGKNKDK